MTRYLGRRGKQTLDVLHYWTSLGWLGVGLSQLALNLIALGTDDPALRHAAHEIGHTFDRTVLIVLGFGSFATGALLGWRTKWGLLRYRWVVVKLVLTVAMLIFTPVWMGGWIGDAVALTRDAAAPADPAYVAVRDELMAGSVSLVLTLLGITVISVVRPWGRVRPVRRSPGRARWTRSRRSRGAAASPPPGRPAPTAARRSPN